MPFKLKLHTWHRVIFLTFATCHAIQTLYIYSNVKLMQLSLSLAWKYTWKGTAWDPFYILYNAELSPSKTTIHWISRYTRNREYFWTRWKRGKVLYVYSKHNNGKDRSREDHGASPSLWKELISLRLGFRRNFLSVLYPNSFLLLLLLVYSYPSTGCSMVLSRSVLSIVVLWIYI
jgi:hypothetical protein